jgi:hypothetical protein
MMRTLLQWILIFWFVGLSALVFIPSAISLFRPEPALLPPPPPIPPTTVSEASNQMYAQQVVAYQQYVAAYAAYCEKVTNGRYDAVVTKTLTPLLEKLIIAFLAYAFVVTAATTVDNAVRMRNNEPPQPLGFFQ